MPGASASTYSGRAILLSLPRHLLRGRCRLGAFCRSFLHGVPTGELFSGTGDKASSRRGFPMPVPYPEAFKRLADDSGSALLAQKRGVNCVVMVLNFLYLGRPRVAPVTLRLGAKLSRPQWEAVQRIEKALLTWTTVSPIGPVEMGRTAAKMEDLEGILHALETSACTLGNGKRDYFGNKENSVAEAGHPRLTCGEVVGFSSLEAFSTFKQVEADRLVLVGEPSFDPSPYLDELGRNVFQNPCECRASPSEVLVPPPKVKVHCSASEKMKLYSLLDSTKRLSLHARSEVLPDYGSGLFCVVKDLKRDRLILDSRPANILEPELGRWIKALASAESLTRILLRPDKVLVSSGNDLKDFYYFFTATPSRCRRNVLVGPMHVNSVRHLQCFDEGLHGREQWVYGALATMAMGDSAAVELAQTAHLGIVLQHDIAVPSEILTMSRPVPRQDTFCGIIIDDFISFSQVPRDRPDVPSPGALMADKLQDVYKDVKLMPNEQKAFRDELRSNYWGVDLDGETGLLRGSLKRAVPLVALILRVVRLQRATADLLRVICGSVVALYLFRRRLLATLDHLFASFRGRDPRAIVALDSRLSSTLLMTACLIPLAVTNLRARVSDRLTATDASSWGEAAVCAKLPRRVAEELYRHTLRKSVWARLLAPAAAWERTHGLLAPDKELPEGVERYRSNPLWEHLACCLEYRLLFKREKSGQRHINVGELKAMLRAEEIHAKTRPESREIYGLDSQVCLAVLQKGRSSSPALNQALERSIPNMLAFDVYAEEIYFNTHESREQS